MNLRRDVGLVVLVAGLMGSGAARAGWLGGGPKTDANAELAKLFGAKTSFTATEVMTVKDSRGREVHSAEMACAYSEGKMRTEVDMAKTKAGQNRPEATAQLVNMGMNLVVTLARPDQKMTYLIYPGLQAYCEFPQTPPPAAPPDRQPPKIERTELGKETLDGHPCVKYLVTVTADSGQKQEMTTWQATDLNQFPIQTQMIADGNQITTQFKEIKFGKPAATLFELPAGYKRYATMQEMMMGSMKKMMPPTGGGE